MVSFRSFLEKPCLGILGMEHSLWPSWTLQDLKLFEIAKTGVIVVSKSMFTIIVRSIIGVAHTCFSMRFTMSATQCT